MSINRLNLNFKLETKEERVEFIEGYLDAIPFKPTTDELDMMAKYILWGKDLKTGLNGRQEGLELETRYKTWDSQHVESLDALIESPAFSEAMLRSPLEPPSRIPREVFSRAEARATAPTYILDIYESLWREIDETELLLNFYELDHNRRKKPPRAQLLNRFSASDIDSISLHAKSLSSYNYLKLKHKLVELRREQYTLKDEYKPILISNPTFSYKEEEAGTFGEEIFVLPVGIPQNGIAIYDKIFNEERFPIPDDFSEEDLIVLSRILWRSAPSKNSSKPNFFDFENPDHLYRLFGMWDFLQEEVETAPLTSNLKLFLRAASVYRTLANLDPVLEDILNLKLSKKTNQDIADIINSKYHKNYQANYISTLYCKKCLGAIAKTAHRHREILENCFFPENFKQCKDCDQILLRDEENFVRRHRASDGFSPRCKSCEKAIRDNKK